MANVLIVEDETIIGMLLSEVVTSLGHTVCAVVVSEDEAVAAAVLHQPDLMIVDAGLASGNGLSAVDTILAARFVPHIFTTGNAFKVRMLKPEAVVLEKPFHESEIEVAIAQALSATQGLPA
jgi:two-component system, response regulator PdtaR